MGIGWKINLKWPIIWRGRLGGDKSLMTNNMGAGDKLLVSHCSMGIHVLVFCDAQKQHLYCKNMMQRYQRYIQLGNFVIKILSSYLSPNGRRKRQWKLSLPRIYSKTLDTETELNNTSVKNELTSYCVKPQCTLPKLRHAQ